MNDEEISVFIKKYKQILKFKEEATKKDSKRIKRNKVKTAGANNNTQNTNIILPNIVNKRNINSQINSHINRNNSENFSVNRNKKNIKQIADINKIIDKVKKNSKEYRKFIQQQGDISPKKNIKVISDNVYQRLQKKNENMDLLKSNNSADDTNLNSSKDVIVKNEKSIKLPFLANIKSKYKDYDGENNRKRLLNQSVALNDKNDIKIYAKSISKYKSVKYLEKIGNKKDRKNYYLVLPGNNHQLIEKCLLTRPNWEKISNENSVVLCNLIWAELSQQINFSLHGEASLSQIINHFECHNELSNKKNLFVNLLRYCEYNSINLFSFFPLTISLNFHNEFLGEQIDNFKKLFDEISTLIEDDKNKDNDFQRQYSDYFRVNLVKRVGSLQKMVLPKSSYIGKNLWLLKRTNLNRGRQIKIFSDLDAILNEIEEAKKDNRCRCLLLQKYLEDPLLYNSRKFDIRIWVLFTYTTKDYRFGVYVFKQGHLKACSEPFDINSTDLFVHLTNYSVQKYNKNFSKIEIGNEISFETFQNELDKEGKNINFYNTVFPKITRIIAITANAAKSKINILNRQNCFEIFGYDFILDKNFEPFLLEINTNPGYEISSPLIEMLVPRMIDDAFRLTIDEVFERNDNDKNKSKFKVDGYTDEENMWQPVNLRI